MSTLPIQILEEQRTSRRRRVERPVRVAVAGGLDELTTTGDASAGGLFVRTRNPPPVGTRVKFVLDLGQRAVRGFAEVSWIRLVYKSPEEPKGMGMRFVVFLDDGALHYDRFLADVAAGRV